jgi:hypothetical protein
MTRRRNHVLAHESIRRLAKSGQCPEQELSDLEARTWFAVFLPRGESEPIMRKLNQATFRNRDTLSCRNV